MKNFLFYKGRKFISKLSKIDASNYAIAAGFACGASISVTPFVGFHTLLAILTALIIRGNLVSAAVGTVIGNPWTFAVIWPLTYETGRKMLHIQKAQDINFKEVFERFLYAFKELNFDLMANDIDPIIKPMFLGSIWLYIIVWIVSFLLIKHVLQKVRKTS